MEEACFHVVSPTTFEVSARRNQRVTARLSKGGPILLPPSGSPSSCLPLHSAHTRSFFFLLQVSTCAGRLALSRMASTSHANSAPRPKSGRRGCRHDNPQYPLVCAAAVLYSLVMPCRSPHGPVWWAVQTAFVRDSLDSRCMQTVPWRARSR